jgi:hypothetical protein
MEIPEPNAGKIDLSYLLKVIVNPLCWSMESQMWNFIPIAMFPLIILLIFQDATSVLPSYNNIAPDNIKFQNHINTI